MLKRSQYYNLLNDGKPANDNISDQRSCNGSFVPLSLNLIGQAMSTSLALLGKNRQTVPFYTFSFSAALNCVQFMTNPSMKAILKDPNYGQANKSVKLQHRLS